MSDWPQKFLHAYSQRHHYDSVTASHDELTLADAYDIQHQYVMLRKEPICGFKAALTAPAAQQAMAINTPIVGALFAAGEVNRQHPISLQTEVLLETEIGYRTATAITEPVSPDTVLQFMRCCLPLIELASPNLATKPNGLDLVATNSASHQFVCGTEQDIDGHVLDALAVSLKREDEILLSGHSNEVLGGQREALAWLVNETLARGYGIDADFLLMSGSIGGMAPASSGSYTADFGALGSLSFSIT